jgi:YD repeat-containing protein
MTVRLAAAALAIALAGVSPEAQGRAATRPAAARVSRAATCAFDLGAGVRTKQRFCDVVVANTGAESVALPVPTRSGAASLLFDLHPRVQLQAGATNPVDAFVRSAAVVAVVRATGDVIDRAAVIAEYRSPSDLFDRFPGSGPDGYKIVAPGAPEPVRVAIPAGVTAVGIVGVRVELTTARVRYTYDAPGRPVAIVSNLRIEYR